uniref:Mbl_2 protein n=1 Tax=Fopius arisanus TaxID=64838 RepID=A0A0C9RCQ2_9HYME
MAMVNMNNLLNGKDSRWLQLEVCREFQRNKCTRPDTECKFAHPPANVEVQNGRVTACYDSIKGRCNREKPPCKYFHPPQHLKDQLLINGRNHLALKNALMQQMGLTPGQPLVPGQVPTVATNPYLTGMPQVNNTYTPYFTPSPIMPAIMGPADPTGVGSPLGVVQQTVAMPQKMPRTDRLEVCREFQRGACKRGETECRFAHPLETVQANEDGSVTVCMDAVKGRCNRDPCRYFHPPLHLQAHIKAAQSRASIAMESKSFGSFYYDNFAFPGMVPYKRPAGDKSGMPVYQATGATTYQQLMQLPQPFVPVSCEYAGTPPLPQTSNQSIASAQNSIQSQASSSLAQVSESNGVLGVNNPPPPPSTASSAGIGVGGAVGVNPNDNKQVASNHDGENTRNSPELNHSSSPQVNQLTAHSAGVSIPTMSAMTTSMPNIPNFSMSNIVSLANASLHQANVNSMANYTMANMAHFNVLNTLGMGHNLATMDPAALAKEVAQKNYAKAIKMQTSQQYGINPLTALNYTGVALNKQALAINQTQAAAAAAATAQTRQMLPPGLAGIPGGPLSGQLPASLLHHYQRPPSATPINPYSLIRQHPMLHSPYVQASFPGVPAAALQQATNPYAQNPYTMLPGMSAVGVAGVPGVATAVPGIHQVPTANPATIAAQPQVAIPVSTGVIMQPYKKMKTT